MPSREDISIDLPKGITLQADCFGKRCPAHLHKNGVHFLGGRVSENVPIFVIMGQSASITSADVVMTKLRRAGYHLARIEQIEAGQA